MLKHRVAVAVSMAALLDMTVTSAASAGSSMQDRVSKRAADASYTATGNERFVNPSFEFKSKGDHAMRRQSQIYGSHRVNLCQPTEHKGL